MRYFSMMLFCQLLLTTNKNIDIEGYKNFLSKIVQNNYNFFSIILECWNVASLQ
ncbi:hypothetical protein C2G38_2103935 [Gigaspora rosea]|uniref:Uncharacterized protein n=1 Tax=Gigaspora rosea TaxID=44941 RepID=A0A397UM09_9GLOM|nr:hypothetical protein C2G38_2103935 [Gigaspora rosea]